MKFKLIPISVMAAMLAFSSCNKEPDPVISIMPQPLKIEQTGGVFTLTNKVKIVAGNDAATIAQANFLKNRIVAATGFTPEIVAESGGKTITLLTDGALAGELGSEGYDLSIASGKVEIRASAPAGLFYGIQTLFQLLPPEIYGNKVAETVRWVLPCARITDKPRFAWRGFMLDVSRHFFSPEYIYEVLDNMAVHKLNRFQMHLTDDQGWRVEIKKYPKLTEVGAWRVDRESSHWNSREVQKPGEKATYGGFYTQDDIRKFVSYAAERHITIIPEIEMPAHSTGALAAYPEYTCTGKQLTVLPGGIWPCNNIFCAGKEETFGFIEDILSEIIGLFPSEYIHIGGDEADKSEWLTCKSCQNRLKTEGLKDEKELQSYFIRRIEKYLNAQGRQLIGWDEILEGGLAPNAAVMSWRGTEGGIAAARSGHPVVMTPTSNCYFDYYQGNPESEPLAIGGYLPLEKVYSFDPVPSGLSAGEAKMILGAQANLWTEYVADPSHADYMTYPRLTALAELCWTSPGQKNYDDFCQRLTVQTKRYEALGINYSKSYSAVDVITGYNKEKNLVELTLKSGFPGTEIRYTLDGTDPVQTGKVYEGPFALAESGNVKAVAFLNGKPLSAVSEKKVLIHLATGKKVTYKTPYSDKYTGGGDFALVDGIRGTINLTDGSWQAFEGSDLIATIDLGSIQTIRKITVGTLQSTGSWIFFPTQIDFWTGTDGTKFDGAGEAKNQVDIRDGSRKVQNFTTEMQPVQARYVMVIARSIHTCPDWHAGKGSKAWLFVDEITVE